MNNGTDDALLILYSSGSTSLAIPLPGIEPELTTAQSLGGGSFNYESTVRVSNSSVLGDITAIVCDTGAPALEDRQTVELRRESQ